MKTKQQVKYWVSDLGIRPIIIDGSDPTVEEQIMLEDGLAIFDSFEQAAMFAIETLCSRIEELEIEKCGKDRG